MSAQLPTLRTFSTSPYDYGTIGPPLQAVHSSKTPPTGLAIDPDQILYLTYPRNFGPTPNNVVICPSYGTEEPWPTASIQNCTSSQNASTCFINVQNIVLDSLSQLWILDSGIPPGSKSATLHGAKIMSFDYKTRALKRTFIIPASLTSDGMNANDLRINNTLGEGGYAFITDASASGSLLAMDLSSGHTVRRLHNTTFTRADADFVSVYNGSPVYGWNGTRKIPLTTGADGIALQSGNVYWGVLASRRWYYVSQAMLVDEGVGEQEVRGAVRVPGQIGTEQAGFTADDAGRVYMLASEHNAVFYAETVGEGGKGLVEPRDYFVKTLVRSALIQHADSAAVWDGWLYFCTNQLSLGPGRQYGNVDKRRGPFLSYRVWIGAGPAI
ncbi:hypothetical protein EJ04DRAFT_588141 [Polyplosphaeria fusca]|uniref:Major royal jelly protein n=1 Tax=Polyplosphaeria fusca TaxID=682080 RepID=A0A9P4QRY8_9PLEO|nr:hypothetical protein EJ04DRAFT_588141 [Polyplosphaeria fusca]